MGEASASVVMWRVTPHTMMRGGPRRHHAFSATACTIQELQTIAKRRVPKMFYQYADSGSWTQTTYRENEEDLQRLKFRQRIAVDMSNRTTETTMAGQQVKMPLAIAPCGLTGMQHPNG